MMHVDHFASVKQVHLLAEALRLPRARNNWSGAVYSQWPRWLQKMLEVALRERRHQRKHGCRRLRIEYRHKPKET